MLIDAHEAIPLELADRAAADIADALKESFRAGSETVVTGPSSAYIGRINESYRRVIYARDEKYDKLTSAIELSEKVFNKKYSDSDVDVEYDMDPMNVV